MIETPHFTEAQYLLAFVTIIGTSANIFYGIRMNGGRYWKEKYEEMVDNFKDLKKSKDNYKRNYNALLNDYNVLLGEHRASKHFENHDHQEHKELA